MPLKDIDPAQLLETLHQGVVVHAASSDIVYANPRALEILRLTNDQALGRDALDPDWRFVDAHLQPLPLRDYPVNKVLASKSSISNMEIGICDSSRDGITWVLCNAYPQFDLHGDISKVVVGLLDISDRKNDIPFAAIVAHANDVILITEAQPADGGDHRIVYVNRAFCELTGFSQAEVIGKSPKILQGPDTSTEVRQRIRNALENQQSVRETILNYSKSGVPYWLDLNIFPLKNALGEVTHFAAVERDVTDQVHKEAELQALALEDPLTGLLNRRGFFESISSRLAAQERRSHSTLAMIDIDYFKTINDTYGHEAGDLALKNFADILRHAFRDSDVVCRYGGEEFVVLLFTADLSAALRKLENFRHIVADTVVCQQQGDDIKMTVSIGLTRLNNNPQHIESALNAADKALYEAKHSGRNCSVVNSD